MTIIENIQTSEEKKTQFLYNSIYLSIFFLIGAFIGYCVLKNFGEDGATYIGLGIYFSTFALSFISPFIYKLLIDHKNKEASKYFDIQLITFKFILIGSIVSLFIITMFKLKI